MTESDWLAETDPAPMVRHLIGVTAFVRVQDATDFPNARGSDRKLRLFACACYHRISHRLPDGRTRAAVAVAEAVADGVQTTEALQQAEAPLRDALRPLEPSWRMSHGAERYALAPTHEALALGLIVLWGEPQKAAYYASSNAYLAVETLDNPTTTRYDAGYSTEGKMAEREAQTELLRDIFGNPFSPAHFDPSWRTATVGATATQMYDTRDFTPAPILADALQDAGCENDDILNHLRGPGPHVRGCWTIDLILGKA